MGHILTGYLYKNWALRFTWVTTVQSAHYLSLYIVTLPSLTRAVFIRSISSFVVVLRHLIVAYS